MSFHVVRRIEMTDIAHTNTVQYSVLMCSNSVVELSKLCKLCKFIRIVNNKVSP